jgi:hypothetical protein
MQDYGTETSGDCGTESCDSHICSCRTMVQRPLASVLQRLVISIYFRAGLWYRDLWRLPWLSGLPLHRCPGSQALHKISVRNIMSDASTKVQKLKNSETNASQEQSKGGCEKSVAKFNCSLATADRQWKGGAGGGSIYWEYLLMWGGGGVNPTLDVTGTSI